MGGLLWGHPTLWHFCAVGEVPVCWGSVLLQACFLTRYGFIVVASLNFCTLGTPLALEGLGHVGNHTRPQNLWGVLRFWILGKGLAAPSWWSSSEPQAAPVPQAGGKPWSSLAHPRSCLEAEGMASEQTKVWSVKRAMLRTGTWGWAGSHCRWSWALIPFPTH